MAAWPSWAARARARAVACARKEGSWAGGCQGNGLRAESEEEMERKEEILFLFLFRVFQKYFSNGFEFLFSNFVKPIIPRMNLQQHECINMFLTLYLILFSQKLFLSYISMRT